MANEDIHLKISTRNEVLKGVLAGIHAFSQFELLNTHPSEPIIIHSVVLTVERTEFEGKTVHEPFPQQLHISRVEALRLDPGAVAIVPVTFLPRYPHDDIDMPMPSKYAEGGDSAPPLSSYQRADLAHLVGDEALEGRPYFSAQRRNNLRYNEEANRNHGKLYEVHTSIVVDTSRGRNIVPLSASSLRTNHYRVPERIRFHPPPAKPDNKSHSGTMLFQAVDRSGDGSFSEFPAYDCYDLYIYNPRTETLRISEVAVSKPLSIALFNIDEDARLQNAKHTITEWAGREKLVNPGETQYVTTACPMGANNPLDWVVKPAQAGEPWQIDYSRLDVNLGYLQLKTEQDTLFVLLEWFLTVQHLQLEVTKQTKREKLSLPRVNGNGKTRLTSIPTKLKAHLVPFVTTRSEMKMSIQNVSPVPLKVMRASLLIDDGTMKVVKGTDMKLNLMIDLLRACDSDAQIDLDESTDFRQCKESGIIDGNTIWKDSLVLEVEIVSNSTMKYLRTDKGSSKVTGMIVVTATTDVGITYDEWLDLMKGNPYNVDKVVFEIPWSIMLVDGVMHAVIENSTAANVHLRNEIVSTAGGETVDAFFFPFEPLDLRDWTYWPGVTGRTYDYGQDGVTHNIRVVTFSRMPFQITKLRIEREESDPRSRVCNRFKATVTGPKSPSSVAGFYDIGGIKVEYSFEPYREQFRRRERKSELHGVVHPSVCFLTFETTPIHTGEHVIDLVVFTGKLELSPDDPGVHVRSNGISDFSFTPRGREHLITASMVTGFQQAMAWFESSVMGSSLLKHLRQKSLFGRWTSAASLFKEYVLNLANVTEGGVDEREGFVEPIVMHAGAIAHGEILTMPLHFTNHNPVPVQVFLDVGEVEGMSIAISRETSRLRGDGNSMLDFLPHRIPLGIDRVVGGAWDSHSREGLKNFLMTSDFALSFFNFLPHRDAIEVSPRATARLPMLRSLYKKRAKATFHADMQPLSFYSEKMNGCDGDEKNPSNYLQIKERVQGWPGPFLLSDDGNIAHGNNVCDPDFIPDISSYPRSANMMYLKQTPVTIPPGGVARFDVKIRAPERDNLDKDVTPFLSTGLVISTDHGQVMPIIVTFEALLGQLKLSHGQDWIEQTRTWQKDEEFSHHYSGDVVEVPLRLFQTSILSDLHQHKAGITIAPSPALSSSANRTTWMHPAEVSGVSLYLASSFSRDVVLRDIESCNPWFYVDMTGADQATNTSSPVTRDLGAVKIGTLHTAISCPTMQDLLDTFHEIELPINYPMFPSFYQCALEWLENRTLLQSYGCGVRPMPKKFQHSDYGAEDDATERALDALNHAITFSMFKYGNGRLKYEKEDENKGSNATWGNQIPDINSTRWKTGGARGSALVDRLTLDIFAEITDAWRIISELDLHSITSSFKATLEYVYSEKGDNPKKEVDEPQSLTVSMRDVAIRTQLSMPQLVEKEENYLYRGSGDQEDDFFSVLEFPPTAVADVVAMTIPLRNPTGVPVKVKLATISWDEIRRDAKKAEEFNTLATDEIRELYLNRFESVFTQTGFDAPVNSPGKFWWEGHGSFFQADDQGQLVQSRHNISITAGAKARVSMVNPSLYAQSAFTNGCGTRCGLREEGNAGNRDEVRLRMSSPIGASAAAGAALVGRPRATSDQKDTFNGDEATLSAGGTAFVDTAPAAFAIPYSSFDEIILPPYGKAKIGPILFRPPGRYGLMGCDTILDSDAIPFGEKVAETCSSTVFQSMVLLENSLTGLERVVLRGKGMWESIVFLDPIGSDSLDAYGDLELRNGHTTLVFPGSCVSSQYAGSSPHPVTKGVIVQNDGDIDVEFSRVFFTDSSKIANLKAGKESNTHGCSYRGFRLLECSPYHGPSFRGAHAVEDNEKGEVNDISDEDANLFHGFRVPAGSNRTIFIEHSPDCTFQSEYVILNFEFKRDNLLKRERRRPSDIFFSPDGSHKRILINQSTSLRRKNLELLVGFDMTTTELRSCIPVQSLVSSSAYVSGSRNISLWNNKTSISSSELARLKRAISIGEALRHHLHSVVHHRYLTPTFLVAIASLTAAVFLATLILTIIRVRWSWSNAFKAKIQGPRGGLKGRADSLEGNISQSNWSSTFRCLARADPTSSELQTIGREQVRQIVLHRYKIMGVLSPQCIDAMGSFNREGAMQNIRGNAPVKTLSESIFQQCRISTTPEGDSMPCGLGWRCGVARRIMQTDVRPAVTLRSDAVLSKRRASLRDVNSTNGLTVLEGSDKKVDITQKHSVSLSELSVLSNGEKSDSISLEQANSTRNDLDRETSKDSHHRNKQGQRTATQDAGHQSQLVVEDMNSSHRKKQSCPPAISSSRSDESNSTGSSSLLKSKYERENALSVKIPDTHETKSTPLKRTNGNGARTNYRRPGEPPSSPSSLRSFSSRSTRTDTTSSPVLSPIGVKKTRMIRPPPGLAPPPGFSGMDTSGALDLSTSSLLAPSSLGELSYGLQRHSQSLSALLPPLDTSLTLLQPMRTDSNTALDQLYSTTSPSEMTQNSSSLFQTIRATDEKNLEISQRALHSESFSSSIDVVTHLPRTVGDVKIPKVNGSGTTAHLIDSGGGFDMMGFLDNLLEESGQDENDDDNESLASNEVKNPLLLGSMWSTGRQSRAAAYGISVEGNSGESHGEEQAIVQAILAGSPHSYSSPTNGSTVVIPLLTPAALGNSMVSVFDDDDDRAPPQDYNSGDFYARLLGE